MRHVVLDDPPAAGCTLTVSRELRHYLVDVLRHRQGDRIPFNDGGGGGGTMEVVSLGRASLTVRVLAYTPGEEKDRRVLPPPLEAWIAVLKGKDFDRAIRAAVELGVDRIVPVLTARCVARPETRRERWLTIVREACQQSGRTTVPPVDEVQDLPSLLGGGAVPPDPPWFVFHESAGTVLEAFHGAPPESSAPPAPSVPPAPGDGMAAVIPWRVCIGPEGGLTDQEVALLEHHQWACRRLAVPVLRAVTAVPAAIAVVQHLRGCRNPAAYHSAAHHSAAP